jgi:hypothetical protein
VVIGIQHYRDGLYFHPEGGNKKGNPNFGRSEGYFKQMTDRLKSKLLGVPVRAVSGPLTQVWAKWDPAEKFPARELCALEQTAQAHAAETRYVHVRGAGFGFCEALVPEGMVFAVTKYEMLDLSKSDSVVDATDWDLSDMNEALKLDLDARRAEQDRLRRMVAKVRNSRRGIRRTIYDADIIRIIKWAEGGQTPAQISKRVGLPGEQVTFIVNTATA